jgi:hypothetical protein
MPPVTIEFDDKGDPVGELPQQLTAMFTRIENASYGKGYGKGVETAAQDAKKQIEDNVKAEVARLNAMAPLEAEKHARIAEENSILQQRLNEHLKESDRALKGREEAHAREIVARTEALQKRNGKIQELVKAQIRADAMGYGARDESLTELEVVLINGIGYDDDMEPFVKDADGKPATLHGKNVSLSQFVKQYIDSHPHHRKAPAGAPGNARGGASYYGTQNTATVESARARVDSGDRSASAINELFEAGRKRAS